MASRDVGAVAARHHERLDGSGYHRGAGAGDLSLGARVLAAADACQAMTEPRPHRPALTPAPPRRELDREVVAGRLDGDAVAAVLAGGRGRAGAAPRAVPGRAHRARGRGPAARRARALQQGDRRAVASVAEDRRPPRGPRLRQGGRLHARGGGALRGRARAAGPIGHSPDGGRHAAGLRCAHDQRDHHRHRPRLRGRRPPGRARALRRRLARASSSSSASSASSAWTRRLNAFRVVRAERALAEADAAQARLAAARSHRCSACRSPSRTTWTSPAS